MLFHQHPSIRVYRFRDRNTNVSNIVSYLEFNIKTSVGLRWTDSKSLKGRKLDTDIAPYQLIKSAYTIYILL